jgi:RNA polymerase sigma-70 factor (ECF subfamily)
MRKEQELITRAKQGDQLAVGELYDRHYDAVYQYIYYRVTDQGTAEDLTADVFIRMVEHLEDFQYRGRPFLAWLYTMARNRVIDHYRAREKEPALPLKEELLSGEIGRPKAFVERQETTACFTRAFHHLTELQRDVLHNRFIEQRTTRETAQMLEKTREAVRALQYRALIALKAALDEEDCL